MSARSDHEAGAGSDAGVRVRRSNWGRFGADDGIGTLNYLTKEAVLRGVASVRTGDRIPLNLPINAPAAPDGATPAFKPDSMGYRRHAYRRNLTIRDGLVANDDYVSFATQGSTQWDSLAHVGLEEPGVEGIFYNGVTRDDFDEDGAARRNGVDAIARVGVVGRGVLVDVARYLTGGSSEPLPVDYVITPKDTKACLAHQGVTIRSGDIVCFRTGWADAYLAADDERRAAMVTAPSGGHPRTPGIAPSHVEMADDQRWAAVGADNPGVEALPLTAPSAHVLMLRNLGMPFAELLLLGDLGLACAADGRYEFLFVSVPLWIPGGTGSPANAIAIR